MNQVTSPSSLHRIFHCQWFPGLPLLLNWLIACDTFVNEPQLSNRVVRLIPIESEKMVAHGWVIEPIEWCRICKLVGRNVAHKPVLDPTERNQIVLFFLGCSVHVFLDVRLVQHVEG